MLPNHFLFTFVFFFRETSVKSKCLFFFKSNKIHLKLEFLSCIKYKSEFSNLIGIFNRVFYVNVFILVEHKNECFYLNDFIFNLN